MLRLLLRFSLHSLKTLQVLSVHTAPHSHLITTVVCDIAMEEVLFLTVLLASFLSKKKRHQRPTPLIFFTTVSLFTCASFSLCFSTNFSYAVLYWFLSQYYLDLMHQRQGKLWYNSIHSVRNYREQFVRSAMWHVLRKMSKKISTKRSYSLHVPSCLPNSRKTMLISSVIAATVQSSFRPNICARFPVYTRRFSCNVLNCADKTE